MSHGELLTYTDVNGHRNFAGRTPNDSARLMSVADPNQALFTPESRNHFREFHPNEFHFFHDLPDITIKDQRYGACQLRYKFLNGNIPKQFATETSDSAPGAYPVPWIPFDHSDPEVRVKGVTGAEYEAVREVSLTAFSKHCKEVHNITVAERGINSRNYCVTTSEKKLLIKWHKIMNNRDQISSLYEIQTKIAKSGIFNADCSQALMPRKTSGGQLLVRRGLDYVSAFPFIDGVTYFDASSLDVVEEVGRAYGKVNRVLSNYRPSNKYWPISRPLDIEQDTLDAVFEAYRLQKAKGDMDYPVCYLLEKESALIRESLEEVSTVLPNGEPSLVELHPHNLFFRGKRCVLIFDYETVTNQWPEIAACAYAIHRFCREYARDKPKKPEAIKKSVEAFLKGYKKGRGREFPEIHDKLHWWIKRTNLPKLIRALSYVTGVGKNPTNRPPAVLSSEVVKFIACLKEADQFKM